MTQKLANSVREITDLKPIIRTELRKTDSYVESIDGYDEQVMSEALSFLHDVGTLAVPRFRNFSQEAFWADRRETIMLRIICTVTRQYSKVVNQNRLNSMVRSLERLEAEQGIR
jgi:hypothetical protein